MFAERLKKLRKRDNITQLKLSEILGIDRTTISKWESTDVVPQAEILKQLSMLFNVTVDYLIGIEREVEIIDFKPSIKLPVYGRIPAGIPIEAVTDIVDYIELPMKSLRPGREYICLKVMGTSMSPKFEEDDVVIIERNPVCESGQDCAVYINGFDVTLKRVIKQETGLLLQPLNPAFEAKFYPYYGSETIQILGIVRGMQRLYL